MGSVSELLFSGVLIYVFGEFALVTGDTALHAFQKRLKYGKILAILILVSVCFGQWNSLMGILGISSNIIYEILNVNYPGLSPYRYQIVLFTAAVIIGSFYLVLLVGKYSFLKKF